MSSFTIYPAIDLRAGRVVRLKEGDPDRQSTYSTDSAQTAQRWLEAGARRLHVVNLDGAFGENDRYNREALHAILDVTKGSDAQVQFGGGVRSLEAVEHALTLGVDRVERRSLQPGLEHRQVDAGRRSVHVRELRVQMVVVHELLCLHLVLARPDDLSDRPIVSRQIFERIQPIEVVDRYPRDGLRLGEAQVDGDAKAPFLVSLLRPPEGDAAAHRAEVKLEGLAPNVRLRPA